MSAPCCRAGAPPTNGLVQGGPNLPVPPPGPPAQLPPALPPRPQGATPFGTTPNYYGSMYGMGSPWSTYGAYGSSAYGSSYGYGGYPGMGGTGMYGGAYGMPQDSQVSRLAEEQTRTAFQSIENVVRMFSSMSFLLDSSYNAILTSFRAVLSLADQFSHLKNSFQHLFATLSLLRLARWLWAKVRQLLGHQPPLVDQAWSEVAAAGASADWSNLPGGHKKPTDWAMVVLSAIAIAGPWVMWKLTSRMVENARDKMLWAVGEKPFYQGIALHDFSGSATNELTISSGEQIRIAPKDLQPQVRGWLLASKMDNTDATGLVPGNYVRIVSSEPGTTAMRAELPSKPLPDLAAGW